MKHLLKLAAVILCGIMLWAALPIAGFSAQAENSKEKTTLKFNENGEFKILAIADTQDTHKPQKEMLDIINKSLDKVKPDLVIFLGDNVAGAWAGATKENTAEAIRKIIEPVDSRGIPFAIVFGNHDHEGLCNKSNKMTQEEAKEFQLGIYQEYSTCLAIEGEEMTGCGTYNLLIKDSKAEKNIFNLWLMDSNPYAQEGGYGYVQKDQEDWYIKTSNALKEANGGTPLPSLLFQHIAVPEVYELADVSDEKKDGYVKGNTKMFKSKYYKASSEVIQGAFNEGPCPADVMHGQFSSWKAQGDIIGAFFGHDHVNDYLGKVDGIWLCAVPAAGYYSYGNNHGVRTITLNEKYLNSFETEVIYADDLLGYKVTPAYKNEHGYLEYMNNFLLPIIGCSAAVLILVPAVIFITKAIKKKRRGK